MTTPPENKGTPIEQFFALKAFHPERKDLGGGSVVAFLIALLLGWLSFPMVHNSEGAVLFIAFIGFLILLLKLAGRSDALWIVLAIIVGIVINLVSPNSSTLGGDVLLRCFFCVWLVVLI